MQGREYLWRKIAGGTRRFLLLIGSSSSAIATSRPEEQSAASGSQWKRLPGKANEVFSLTWDSWTPCSLLSGSELDYAMTAQHLISARLGHPATVHCLAGQHSPWGTTCLSLGLSGVWWAENALLKFAPYISWPNERFWPSIYYSCART